MILDLDSGTKELLGVNKRRFRECLTTGAAGVALAAAPAATTAAARPSGSLAAAGVSHLSQKHRRGFSLALHREAERQESVPGWESLGFCVSQTQTLLGIAAAPWP